MMRSYVAFTCAYGDDAVNSYYGSAPGSALRYAVSKGWEISRRAHLCPRHSTVVPANIILGEN